MIWRSVLFLAITYSCIHAAALPADPNDDDFECLSSLQAYDSSSSSIEQLTTVTTITSETIESEVIDTNVPFTTLCDGRARALESYRTYTRARVTTYDPPFTWTQYSVYTEPSPTCTIAETACTPILSSWSSAYNAWQTGSDVPTPTASPHCTTTNPSDPDPAVYTACSQSPDKCTILAPGAQKLYYWPVTTTSGDFCQPNNGLTLTPEPTLPGSANTAVVDGHTLTSPTNYLSLATAFAALSSGRRKFYPCGPPARTNILVPLITTGTETFSSRRNEESPFYAFDFADLNQPIPAEVWDGSYQCIAQYCNRDPIEGEGANTPVVPLPTEVLDLEAEWLSVGCTGTSWNQWTLTPVALQTAAPGGFI